MKKFSELKEGDLIYYWDHCKLHAQYVHSVENKHEMSIHKNLDGSQWTSETDWTIIKAGKSKYPITLNQYRRDSSIILWGRIRRFADLEAAKEWIISLCTSVTNRRNKYKRAFERTDKVVSKYHNILQHLANE